MLAPTTSKQSFIVEAFTSVAAFLNDIAESFTSIHASVYAIAFSSMGILAVLFRLIRACVNPAGMLFVFSAQPRQSLIWCVPDAPLLSARRLSRNGRGFQARVARVPQAELWIWVQGRPSKEAKQHDHAHDGLANEIPLSWCAVAGDAGAMCS